MVGTTQKIKKAPIIHTDKLGQELFEGNYVAGCHRNIMYICKIVKVHNIQLRIQDVKQLHYRDDGWLVYPNETVKLSDEDAIAYILKYA